LPNPKIRKKVPKLLRAEPVEKPGGHQALAQWDNLIDILTDK
jgi:hypothetical protein